jgi:hypothetical protein
MPAVRTPEASRPTRRIAVSGCSLPRRGIGSATSITFDFAALPCGSGLTIRSLAFRPATFLSTLRSGCYQTPRKTRYAAARLRLCRGRHPRRLNSTRLQGANRVTGGSCPPPVPTERGVRFLLRCTFGVPHHALRQVVHSTLLLFVPGSFPRSASSSLCIEGCHSLCMEPASPQNESSVASRFPL